MPRFLTALLLLALPTLAAAQADLALSEPFGRILAPQSGVALGASETVTIRFVNLGDTLPTGTTFTASFRIDADPPVTELVVLGMPLLENSPFTYTFTTNADLSAPGSYSFIATVNLAGDIVPTNNSFLDHVVTHTASSVGGTLSLSGTTLQLSGHTGGVLRWERSRDDGLTWEMLANTTTTMTYIGADHRELFRVMVANFQAPPAYSTTYDSAEP